MEMTITTEAAQWYKKELNLEKDDYIRFFVRYGGIGGLVPGFSLGISTEEPNDSHVLQTEENIHFYIEETDVWYFGTKNIHVSYDGKTDEPSISYD